MFLHTLIVPVVLILLGVLFKIKPQKNIGSNGYSSTMSKKSQEAWDFAQHFSSKILLRYGTLLLIIVSLIQIFTINTSVDYSSVYSFFSSISLLALLLVFVTVEEKLNKTFDENGKYRV